MKLIAKLAIITIVVIFNGSYHAYAQESIEALIKKHLDSFPENQKQLKVSPDSLFTIPDFVKRDLRFNFQKRMALSGHGVLFDVKGHKVKLDSKEIFQLQEEMLKAVRQEKGVPAEGRRLKKQQAELNEIIKKIESVLRTDLKPAERFAALNLLTRAEAAKLEDARRSGYHWRSNYLMNAAVQTTQLKVTSSIIADLINVFENWWITWLLRTDYMNQCAAEGVPVPPDFAISGTDWEFQGPLSTNLLTPGAVANVWTWHEPGQRGACIALPRGTGGPGSLSGIICQGATTGNACFWDNLPKGSNTRIPWGTETLVIRELQDGSDLAENCTGCHKGNNVFLLAPDDPTWCRLLRGQTSSACAQIDGTDIANFTLAVEANVNPVNVPNTSIFHSRYTPISGTPARTGWQNNETIGCGGVCHLGGGAVTPPPMPPTCGVDVYLSFEKAPTLDRVNANGPSNLS